MTRRLRSPALLLSSLFLALLSTLLFAVHTAADAASVAVAASDAASAAAGVRYFVLIDAGSTGSRAHVHKYNVDSGKPLPIVHESQNKKIKPGPDSAHRDGEAQRRHSDSQR